MRMQPPVAGADPGVRDLASPGELQVGERGCRFVARPGRSPLLAKPSSSMVVLQEGDGSRRLRAGYGLLA
jgi:hypothetical protein